jgi:hypothetical protein
MKGYVEAMRGLLYDTARSIDFSGHHPDPEVRAAASGRASLLTPVAKAWCTDLGVELSSLGIQVHGGMGFVEETGAAQFYRDSRIAPIYEGTNGIQAIDLVLRKLPLDGGAVVHSYLGEIDAVAEAVAEAVDETTAPLDSIRTGIEEGAQLLRNATDWMLSRKDPRDALAGATPYLRLFGVVAGAAYLARQALAAHRSAGDDGDGFLSANVKYQFRLMLFYRYLTNLENEKTIFDIIPEANDNTLPGNNRGKTIISGA